MKIEGTCKKNASFGDVTLIGSMYERHGIVWTGKLYRASSIKRDVCVKLKYIVSRTIFERIP